MYPHVNPALLYTADNLTSLSFDPLDYARGGHKAVHERAQSILREALGREPTNEERLEARGWVQLLYDDLKRNSAGELSVPEGGLYPGGTVSCAIAGETVLGKVEFTPKQLSVHLLGPDPAPLAERRIMMLAPYIYTEEPSFGSPANELCLNRTKKLLVDLYYDYLMLCEAMNNGAHATSCALQECRTIINAKDILRANRS